MLVRLIAYVVVGFILYLLARRVLSTLGVATRPAQAPAGAAPMPQLVQDPQCGVYVDHGSAVRRKVPGGELFFCSEDCARAHLARRERPAP
jgi:YHS domain-containing protein